ncbi:MAG TPA: hypothetical protein VIW29_20205 [Polyangiaceae bacterium]
MPSGGNPASPAAGGSSGSGPSPSLGGSSGVSEGGNSATGGTPTGAAGGSSTAGSAGQAPNGGGAAPVGTFAPLCAGLTTAAGESPTKAGACTAADPQLCYKTCGPDSVGFKSETCTAGAYAEQSGCSFPEADDYSCYKIPTALDASCPTETITASTACTVAACTPCADAGGNYYDSKMNLKVGYCVCPMPAAPGGTSKWSCASDTAWPCPTGKGC